MRISSQLHVVCRIIISMSIWNKYIYISTLSCVINVINRIKPNLQIYVIFAITITIIIIIVIWFYLTDLNNTYVHVYIYRYLYSIIYQWIIIDILIALTAKDTPNVRTTQFYVELFIDLSIHLICLVKFWLISIFTT